MKIGDTIKINCVLARALRDSNSLPQKLKETLRKLTSISSNPVKIVSIVPENPGLTIKLQAQDDYNSIPAVMCEGYNGGQGVSVYFQTEAQAETLLETKDTIELFNIYNKPIEGQQLVKLIYNNKNFVVVPVFQTKSISDYSGVIGRAESKIFPYQSGKIKLIDVCQAMDLKTHQKLTTRHFGR